MYVSTRRRKNRSPAAPQRSNWGYFQKKSSSASRTCARHRLRLHGSLNQFGLLISWTRSTRQNSRLKIVVIYLGLRGLCCRVQSADFCLSYNRCYSMYLVLRSCESTTIYHFDASFCSYFCTSHRLPGGVFTFNRLIFRQVPKHETEKCPEQVSSTCLSPVISKSMKPIARSQCEPCVRVARSQLDFWPMSIQNATSALLFGA
jgi:hypothetical protein